MIKHNPVVVRNGRRTAPANLAADEALGVSSEAGAPPERSWRVPLIILALMLVAALAIYGVGKFLQPPEVVGTSAQRNSLTYRFSYPAETPADRILLRANVGITLVRTPNKPDQVKLAPEIGDRQGSFTWTVIPQQGTRGVKRLVGEAEIGGITYKLCEAISDPSGPQPQYAERYAIVNNAGARYTLPQRTDPIGFIAFMNLAIAKVPEGQASVGRPLPADVLALAEKLIPACTQE